MKDCMAIVTAAKTLADGMEMVTRKVASERLGKSWAMAADAA